MHPGDLVNPEDFQLFKTEESFTLRKFQTSNGLKKTFFSADNITKVLIYDICIKAYHLSIRPRDIG